AVRGLVAALAGQGVTATCSRPEGPRYGALDVDSNVPDCRIALGGPDVNPWTARLLAALGPGSEAAGRLAAGRAAPGGGPARAPRGAGASGGGGGAPAGAHGPGPRPRGGHPRAAGGAGGPGRRGGPGGGPGRPPGPAAGRPLRGAAQPGDAERRGHRGR